MIEIKITIPGEEIADGKTALEKRLAVLGYLSHTAPTFEQAQQFVEARPDLYGAQLRYAPESELPQAAQDAKVHTEEVKYAEPAKRGRKKAEPAPNISAAPEARVDPEVEAQDEADEAAEVAANAPPDGVATGEMLRAEMGAYRAKFGMPAVQNDGIAIFTDALGPGPEGGWKLSVVDQAGGEILAKAVAAWRAAVASEVRYGG